MFDATSLFKERLNDHIKNLSRYLRYILNGHTTIALIFLISVLAVYYQQFLNALPANFPSLLIIGLALGAVATWTPINTFLKRPDLVFLTVAEKQMGAYFKRALTYSFIVQLYVLFLVAAIFGPLYTHTFPKGVGFSFLLIIGITLTLKLINHSINWWMLKVRNRRIRQFDLFLRFLITTGLLISIMNQSLILILILVFLYSVVTLNNYLLTRKQVGLAWDVLVEKDEQSLQRFYRMASMFVNVPHLKSRVRKRPLLTKWIESRSRIKNKNTFDYLYKLTFIRSNDYLNMYVRLLLLGGLIIYFLPNQVLQIMISLLFIYMSSFQMISLYQHHRTSLWIDLYPLEKENRQAPFKKFIKELAFIQTGIYTLILLVRSEWVIGLSVLILGSLFTLIFSKYVDKQIKTDLA